MAKIIFPNNYCPIEIDDKEIIDNFKVDDSVPVFRNEKETRIFGRLNNIYVMLNLTDEDKHLKKIIKKK
tara:strand:- start:1795 stop:2001 length:207 start_codon:yes stop_codon:yes gene_type:complete